MPARIAFAELPEGLVPTSKVKCNADVGLASAGQQEHVEAVVARWRGATSSSKQGFSGEGSYAPTSARETAPLHPSASPATERLSMLKRELRPGEDPLTEVLRAGGHEPALRRHAYCKGAGGSVDE